MCFVQCTQCLKTITINHLKISDGRTNPQCSTCRKGILDTDFYKIDYKIFIGCLLETKTATEILKIVLEIHSQNFKTAQKFSLPIEGSINYYLLTNSLFEAENESKPKKGFEKQFLNKLNSIEGYYYNSIIMVIIIVFYMQE